MTEGSPAKVFTLLLSKDHSPPGIQLFHSQSSPTFRLFYTCISVSYPLFARSLPIISYISYCRWVSLDRHVTVTI